MVMHHHKPECHQEKKKDWVAVFKVSFCLHNQDMTVSTVSFKILILLQPNLL